MRLLLLGLIAASALCGAPPTCKDATVGGTAIESCERNDLECAVMPVTTPMVREQVDSPSDKWNGCWPVLISTSHFTVGDTLVIFDVSVTVVPSYIDSEKVDLSVSIEKPDHSKMVFTSKDTPVIVRNGFPMATFNIPMTFRPYGVPTVEATEKGGAKSAKHVYK